MCAKNTNTTSDISTSKKVEPIPEPAPDVLSKLTYYIKEEAQKQAEGEVGDATRFLATYIVDNNLPTDGLLKKLSDVLLLTRKEQLIIEITQAVVENAVKNDNKP